MEKVYDLHKHIHCVVIHIKKANIVIDIFSNSNRYCFPLSFTTVTLSSSITYNKQRTNVICFGQDYEGRHKDGIVIDDFRDGLYSLFKKGKETRGEEDDFLMKAVSDFLPLAIKITAEEMKLEIESFDLLHYAFIIPSEWEEEIREDVIQPIFVQSGLISNQDHQDRLLFFTEIEALSYRYFSERGDNIIMCRLLPEDENMIIKFDLIQTTTTFFDFPNATLFPNVMKSSSVSVTTDDIQGRIKAFLRKKLFPVATTDDGSVRKLSQSKLVSSSQDQIIESIIEEINSSYYIPSSDTYGGENPEEEPWVTFKKEWMLNENQKEFIKSLRPSAICSEIGGFLLNYMKDIISNNFTKSYSFILSRDSCLNENYRYKYDIRWLEYMLEYYRRSLDSIVKITIMNTVIGSALPTFILEGAAKGAFEAIQYSDMYCKPRILSSTDSTTSSSVFLNSKPDAIINLDISLGSTLLTCSVLDEEGLIQQIYNHDYFIEEKHLPPLGNFYTFSNTTILNIKEQFISFAERYLLGDLSDITADDGVSIRKDLLLKMNALLTKKPTDGEILVSTDKQKYIKAFILMYMIYIKEEILYKFLEQLISDQMDMKIGYAVSIEGLLLNNTVENKENLRDIIYASGLVSKDDHSKKLRITTQGERILPAIQKSLELELSLKSYFVLCQLHEDYVQLTLHQVVTEPSSEEKEQESIIVQDEILSIQNIYDSLCSSMWCNLLQDSSLIELCEMHSTSDNSKILDLFSLRVKTEFFANLKGHISGNVFQNNSDTRSTDTINLTSCCNCKVRLTTFDIINISLTPVLQDVARNIYASLLNKELFGNYINIDYLFSFIHFNNNPQLQYAFARILEEEADDFNLELGIETSCLVVPELFSQLLQPVIAQRPLCYKDFKIGALQQVCSENYVFNITPSLPDRAIPIYKSKKTDTRNIECDPKIAFPFLSKGEIINNIQSNRRFYLWNETDLYFDRFNTEMYRFKTMNYLDNGEMLSLDDNIHQKVSFAYIDFGMFFECKDVDIPVTASVRYISYTSSLQLSIKIVGPNYGYFIGIFETGEPLTLTRF